VSLLNLKPAEWAVLAVASTAVGVVLGLAGASPVVLFLAYVVLIAGAYAYSRRR
jgi:hypothetical protein